MVRPSYGELVSVVWLLFDQQKAGAYHLLTGTPAEKPRIYNRSAAIIQLPECLTMKKKRLKKD
jgi:hypothetical protein